MTSERLGRRQVLTAAGAGVVAVAGLGGRAAAATSAHGGRVTGGWLINRRDQGTPGKVRTVVTFADGGAFLALDIDPGAPPLAGSWRSEDHDGFVATFWGTATDPQGASIGTVRVKATGRVHEDRISGTYRVLVSTQGHTQTGSGSFRGTRIDPD